MAGQLIRGRFLVTRWQSTGGVLANGAVHVDAGTVREAGPYEPLRSRHPDAAVVGDGTHLVMPGFVNAHSHGRGITTLRLGIPDEPGETRAVGLRRGLTADTYADVLLGCVRQLEAGITATMHLDSNFGGPAEQYAARVRTVLDAYRHSGIRHSVGLGIRDRNTYGPYVGDEAFLARLPAPAQDELRRWPTPIMAVDDYLELSARLADGFAGVTLQLAPLNPDTCSDELLAKVRRAASARGVMINLHLLETSYQKAHALSRHGRTWVEHLAATGVLGPDVICAHCVWLTDRDIELLRETGAVVVHNASSNLRLRSGLAPVRRLVEAGVPVALGVDSLGLNDEEDMLQEVRLAQLLHSPPGLDLAPISADAALRWATEAGARVIGLDGLGRLEPGCPADLVMARLDRVPAWMLEPGAIAASVVQWLRQRDIDCVMVGGVLAVRGGRCILHDRGELERRVFESARRWAPDPAVQAMKGAVGELYREWPAGGEPYYRLNART